MDTQNTINWQEPIEAVHEDGTVVPMNLDHGPDADGDYLTKDSPSQKSNVFWKKDGSDYCRASGWTIRNVAPKEVEWGPEIKVEGKRPEWLFQDGKLWKRSFEGYEQKDLDVVSVSWPNTDWIRLPANHPHYATPTRTALEQRMEDLVRHAAVNASGYTQEEARAILAELEPVDPILLEARQVVADQYGNNVPHLREQALSGAGDEWFHTKVAIAALSRGRALERGE